MKKREQRSKHRNKERLERSRVSSVSHSILLPRVLPWLSCLALGQARDQERPTCLVWLANALGQNMSSPRSEFLPRMHDRQPVVLGKLPSFDFPGSEPTARKGPVECGMKGGRIVRLKGMGISKFGNRANLYFFPKLEQGPSILTMSTKLHDWWTSQQCSLPGSRMWSLHWWARI